MLYNILCLVVPKISAKQTNNGNYNFVCYHVALFFIKTHDKRHQIICWVKINTFSLSFILPFHFLFQASDLGQFPNLPCCTILFKCPSSSVASLLFSLIFAHVLTFLLLFLSYSIPLCSSIYFPQVFDLVCIYFSIVLLL